MITRSPTNNTDNISRMYFRKCLSLSLTHTHAHRTRLSECISSEREIKCLFGKVSSMLNQSSQTSKGLALRLLDELNKRSHIKCYDGRTFTDKPTYMLHGNSVQRRCGANKKLNNTFTTTLHIMVYGSRFIYMQDASIIIII